MARIIVGLSIDRADVDAYHRDLLAIVESYGAFDLDGEGVQPHRLAAFKADVERAGAAFMRCIQEIPAPGERQSEAQARFAWPWEK